MAQKKKEKEEREAAEKAALAASTSNLEITENTKKIVKDSAVNKKLHGKILILKSFTWFL